MFFPQVFVGPKRSVKKTMAQDAMNVDADELNQIQAMQGRGVSNASQDGSVTSKCDSRGKKTMGRSEWDIKILYIYKYTVIYIIYLIYRYGDYIYIYVTYYIYIYI